MFTIEYKINNANELLEDEIDRKVVYECENVETASYIVAKIKT